MSQLIDSLDNLKSRLVEDLEQHADSVTAENNMYFHKTRDFTVYGIDTVTLRKIMKTYKKEFLRIPLANRFALVSDLFATTNEELGHIAVFILNLSVNEISTGDLAFIEKYPSYFKNWSITDDYALNVMQPLLLRFTEPVLNMLHEWSRSSNLWERRISMVTFVRKIGASGKFTEQFLNICDSLVHDKEDLVRKAVGWALKDTMRGNKPRIFSYVKSLRKAGVSSTIILYAIRDIKDKDEREEILAK